MTSAMVSVIIPVKNSERFIRAALTSVLNQSYENVEIVVVDAQSEDRTLDIASQFPLTRVLQQTGNGLANAWNSGIDASKGEYVGFLDSDDIYEPDKLALQVDELRRRPELMLVDGKVLLFKEPGERLPSSFRTEVLNCVVDGNMPSTWLVRRHLFDLLGRFDEQLRVASDIDWLRRVRDAGVEELLLNELVARKRVHSRNYGMIQSSGAAFNNELTGLLRRSIQRRRNLQ